MRSSGLIVRAMLTLVSILVMSCSVKAEDAPAITQKPARMAFKVVEQTESSEYPLVLGKLQEVDLESEIVIIFTPSVEDAAASSGWMKIALILNQIERLESRRAQLNATSVDVTDSMDVVVFEAKALGIDNEVAELIDQLQKQFNLNSTDVLEIFTIPGIPDTLPYQKLSAWLKKKEIGLRTSARLFADELEKVLVQVSAFHFPVDGPKKRIHVSNYDFIEAGEPRVIDRLGLKLTPAEKKRLESELKGNRLVVNAVHEIAINGHEVADNFKALLKRLKKNLQQLWRNVESAVKSRQALTHFIGSLRRIGTPTYTNLADGLEQVGLQVDNFAELQDCLKMINENILNAHSVDFTDLLLGSGQLLDALPACKQQLIVIMTGLSALPTNITSLSESIDDSTLQEFWNRRIMPDVISSVQKLRNDLPTTIELIAFTIPTSGNLLKGIAVANELQPESDDYILRRLPEAPDAIVDLPRIELDDGDRLTVRVELLSAADGTTQRLSEYRLVARLLGKHRKINGQTIFWKHDSAANSWKLNVAAIASWQYRFRKTDNVLKRFMNSWQPGFGIHLANVSQGEQTVGDGAGINVSVGDNFLSVGYGWNFSENGKRYWLFGFNLLPLLHDLKRLL